jgi:two-component system sensor histidine kinase/response regulator
MEDVSLMRELVGVFMEDSQTLLAEACQALAQQDVGSLHRSAHALKGMVGNYSAAPALAAVSLLTESARSGDLDRAAELLPRTIEEFSILGLALQQFQNRL